MTGTATSRLVRGGGMLGAATLVINAGNYLLNVLLGRWLTPAEFSDANLMVTLMFTIASVALCLQLAASRSVHAGLRGDTGLPGDTGLRGDAGRAARFGQRLHTWAWQAGVLIGAGLAVPAPLWREVFNTGSAAPFVILGIGIPAFLVQSVGRGVMQGNARFGPLAATYLVEMLVRVGVAVLLVHAGAGVVGATAGLTVSFVAGWLTVRLLAGEHAGLLAGKHAGLLADPADPAEMAGLRAYLGSVSVLLVGQVVVSNADILVAKMFLAPHEAGRYAAVALVGRAVFVLSWSVAIVVFPAAAQRHAMGTAAGRLLGGALGAIAGIGAVCVAGAWLVGDLVLRVVLGPEYAGLSAPLTAYAVVTTLFALAHMVASYSLASGRVVESWLVLTAAVVQTVLLLLMHGSIGQLIAAQLVAMVALMVGLAGSRLVLARATERVLVGPA